MFGSTVLDVAVGLSLVYLLFSLLCSSIREGIGRLLEEREAGLVAGMYRFLGERPPAELTSLNLRGKAVDLVAKMKDKKVQSLANSKDAPNAEIVIHTVMDHGLIRGLTTKEGATAHVPAQSFALALLDAVAPTGATVRTIEATREAIAKLPNGNLRETLLPLVTSAGEDLAKLQRLIEERFNDTMARVSTWYKKRTQVWIVVFAVLVTGIGNVDSIAIATTLYRDPVVRAHVIAKAAHTTIDPQSVPSAKDAYAASVGELQSIALPIGWDHRPTCADATWSKLFGLAMTVLALLLGAPFWFDLLSKFSSLRGAAAPRMRPPTNVRLGNALGTVPSS
jgi:hypothetical protein